MKPDTWMPFYWGDYMRDTVGLSRQEHGSYILTICAYWCNGGPLTEAQFACAAGPDRATVERFFVQPGGQGGCWHHKRIDDELQIARENHAKAVENGRKGGLSRAQAGLKPLAQARLGTGSSQAQATVKQSSSPSPSPLPNNNNSTSKNSPTPAIRQEPKGGWQTMTPERAKDIQAKVRARRKELEAKNG